MSSKLSTQHNKAVTALPSGKLPKNVKKYNSYYEEVLNSKRYLTTKQNM